MNVRRGMGKSSILWLEEDARIPFRKYIRHVERETQHPNHVTMEALVILMSVDGNREAAGVQLLIGIQQMRKLPDRLHSKASNE